MIKRSIPWTSQPQTSVEVNKNTRLTDGVVFSWLAAGYISPEQVRNLLPSSESGVTRSPTKGGIGASVATTGSINYAIVPFIGIDKYTIAAVAAPPAVTSRNHLYFSGTEAGPPYPQYCLAVNSNNVGGGSSGKFALMEYDGAWKCQAESIAGMVDGGLHTFMGVRDGTTARLYRDGIDVTGTLGTVSGTHSTTTGNLSVGGSVGASRGGSFPILSVQAWNRALAISEAVSHGVNPWQIFAPQQRNIYVSGASGGLSASLGQPSETDAVSALTSAKAQSVGLISATDTAQGITAGKAASLWLIPGTETAQSLTAAKSSAIGQAAETEAAQPLTAAKYAILGQANESDDALALVSSATSNLGLITETDTALAITAIKTAALGLTSESDSALSVSTSKTAMLGLVTEIEYPLPLVSSASSSVGQVVETDTVFSVTAAKLAGIGYPTETDYIPSISVSKMVTLGLVTETGYVFALTNADTWRGEPFNFASPITRTFDFASSITKNLNFESPI